MAVILVVVEDFLRDSFVCTSDLLRFTPDNSVKLKTTKHNLDTRRSTIIIFKTGTNN